MADFMDKIYCSEQIHIPPTFPFIMKLYCKAAIRTQPYDLLKWSAAYFRALANGEEPPAKERVEFPPYDSPTGITPGYIKILINQFGKDPETVIPAQTLFKKWTDICLEEHVLVKLIALVGPTTQINWVKFVGVCAGYISKTLTHTMVLICELFTEEPEGGMATIPYALFVDLYMYLAQMECGPLGPKELKVQDDEDQEKEVCDAVEKIQKGFYEEEGEIMGEGEERILMVKDERKSEKSGRSSVMAEVEGELEEEEERSREETDTRSTRSKRKRISSAKTVSSQKVMEEEAGEEEERDNYSDSTYSGKSSVKMSISSATDLSDEKDDIDRSEKKKNKETEGETDTYQEGKSVMDTKSVYDGRRRTTFGGVSVQKELIDNDTEYDGSSDQKRKTTFDQYGSGSRERKSTMGTPPRSRKSVAAGSVVSPLSGMGKSSLEKSISQEKEIFHRATLKSDDIQDRKSSVDKKSLYGKFIVEETGASSTKKPGKIDLDQFEDSIRAKIEAKLAEEDELMDEEEKELKDLNTYLTTGSAYAAQKIRIDPLGYKIFKRFMRQDVPGIGPYVETSQIEKVVDYMDYWSHKQNGMVMPRNIRHWMCPPLDKLPASEP